MRANMVELLDRDRAVFPDRRRDLPEMRDDTIVAGKKIPARQHGGGMDRHRFDHDHSGAADRTLGIIGNMPVAGHAVVRHVCRMRAEDDPVAQNVSAQTDGRKQTREEFRHGDPQASGGRLSISCDGVPDIGIANETERRPHLSFRVRPRGRYRVGEPPPASSPSRLRAGGR